jgi:hypothetical protein
MDMNKLLLWKKTWRHLQDKVYVLLLLQGLWLHTTRSAVHGLSQEGEALLQFKGNITDDNLLANWVDTDVLPCNWTGVTCTGNSVTAINLSDFPISGQVPQDVLGKFNKKPLKSTELLLLSSSSSSSYYIHSSPTPLFAKLGPFQVPNAMSNLKSLSHGFLAFKILIKTNNVFIYFSDHPIVKSLRILLETKNCILRFK